MDRRLDDEGVFKMANSLQPDSFLSSKFWKYVHVSLAGGSSIANRMGMHNIYHDIGFTGGPESEPRQL